MRVGRFVVMLLGVAVGGWVVERWWYGGWRVVVELVEAQKGSLVVAAAAPEPNDDVFRCAGISPDFPHVQTSNPTPLAILGPGETRQRKASPYRLYLSLIYTAKYLSRLTWNLTKRKRSTIFVETLSGIILEARHPRCPSTRTMVSYVEASHVLP